MQDKKFESKFLSKICKTDSCWEWTSYVDKNGYGRFFINGKHQQAHRVSYEDKFGKIPEGLVINHLCRNRKCVNPKHLEVVTQKVNIQKGLTGFITGLRMRAKTHCPQNHEYSEKNTYISPNGKRRCRTCIRIQAEQYRQHKKLEVISK